ncbi:unnamed protein product [Calypogeia fissa]
MAHKWALLVLCVTGLLATCQAGFYDQFHASYGPQNIHTSPPNAVEISLDAQGVGSTFVSNNSYLFGDFSVQLKLVEGNSAGTVAAFFIISTGLYHDEVDFEFLGNVSGEPYILHTNLFANGTGDREQEIYLWFDPTADFHTYRVVWNHYQVLWFVDDIPIRVYHNIDNVAPLTFPMFRPMVVSGCIFDGSQWATQGGRIKVDYTAAPFNVYFENFALDACIATSDNGAACGENYAGNSWELAPYNTFSTDWQNQLDWVYQHYQHYDYCTDASRGPTPVECPYNR